MNAINTAPGRLSPETLSTRSEVSRPVSGRALSIGGGFEARSFLAKELEVVMDPLVMVDHYVMTEPTFGVHPHAGLSAVSLLFEDGEGRLHNRDSLGNDFDLFPGDLYWLRAGRGALHDEAPRPGSRIHGLQVFVNLPQRDRRDAPTSLLVRASDMPIIAGDHHRVRVALGASNGVFGTSAPDASMTVLDGFVHGAGAFVHQLAAHRNAWVQAIDGGLSVSVEGALYHLRQGEALTVRSGADQCPVDLGVRSRRGGTTHFALFDAAPIRESYVQQGPFVMGSARELAEIQAAYAAGQLGLLD